jgi:hypothetical protein
MPPNIFSRRAYLYERDERELGTMVGPHEKRRGVMRDPGETSQGYQPGGRGDERLPAEMSETLFVSSQHIFLARKFLMYNV